MNLHLILTNLHLNSNLSKIFKKSTIGPKCSLWRSVWLLAATAQLNKCTFVSVCPSVCLSVFPLSISKLKFSLFGPCLMLYTMFHTILYTMLYTMLFNMLYTMQYTLLYSVQYAIHYPVHVAVKCTLCWTLCSPLCCTVYTILQTMYTMLYTLLYTMLYTILYTMLSYTLHNAV